MRKLRNILKYNVFLLKETLTKRLEDINLVINSHTSTTSHLLNLGKQILFMKRFKKGKEG